MTVTDTWAVCKNTGPRALIYMEAPRGLVQEAQGHGGTSGAGVEPWGAWV